MAGNLANQNLNGNQVYTVHDGMVLCGIDNETLFQDQTPAERFASDIFSNSFSMCLDKTMEEVNNDIKQYSSLTQAQGQIRITPGNRQNIQAFMQWVRDMLRTGREPSLEPFPLQDVASLIRNYKSHKAYMDKSKTVSEAARPIRFKENMHWEDWAPTFLNFLRAIPGRNGVPLSHICREYDEAAQHDPNIDFMENYIKQAPLYGDAFNIDAAEVHTYLINFTSGNDTAEIKMLPNAACKNGRLDYRALQEHYEGIGGKSNKNPILDTRAYEVEYIDGTIEILPANIIAENILTQIDTDGHTELTMEEIIDHRVNNNHVVREQSLIDSPSDKNIKRTRTTRGWDLYVQWKGGHASWVALKDMKHGYPVQTAQYAIKNKLNKEPAFNWWVNYTMRKADRIISKLKSKYWQRTHKYGIQIPKSAEEAYEIDKANANKLWTDAIREEMTKIKGAVRVYEGNANELTGFQQITGHIIFDIKLGEGFRRKARFVGDGHKTETPNSVTYSSVVSRDSVRIILMIAALNELDIEGADIENAYLTAPCREKVWMRGGIEFGELAGEVLIVEKALYGLKSSGAAFRAFLAQTFDKMGFQSSIADPDVWLRPATKPDGEQYYEYIVCYVDDVLGVSMNAKELLQEIQKDFKFKKDKIEPPSMYLGARLERKSLNGKWMWTMCSRDYIKLSVTNIEERANKMGMKIPSKVTTPMINGYIPETDVTKELDKNGITFYQEIIGMMRWAIEIGRVDINTEIALLSSHQAAPREGHLEQLLHIVAFLKKRPKLTLYFDPSRAMIDENMFNGSGREQFKDHYRDAEEELPDRMPRPRGRTVKMVAFVDASHAANKVNRKSHTGYIIFMNRAPIVWHSKRQNTVESSTFTSEFVAMKACMEKIIALRFKLRMFGIPIDGEADMLCDNLSVVNNASKFESTLNKKHASIAYHAIRWAVAAGIVRVGKVDSDENLADAFTKRLPAIKRDYLFGNWTY